jgi:hypothetical protein
MLKRTNLCKRGEREAPTHDESEQNSSAAKRQDKGVRRRDLEGQFCNKKFSKTFFFL